jgi:type I restriction enzyme M protein
MLFYRFISENFTSYINSKEQEAGIINFSYSALTDSQAELCRTDMMEAKGFFMRPSELFENARKRAASDSNLNQTLETIFSNIEASAKGSNSENYMQGLFDDIAVNSNKLGPTVTKRNEILAS